MGKKVLVVLTSVGKIPGTDKETGWYLVRPPRARPYLISPSTVPTNAPRIHLTAPLAPGRYRPRAGRSTRSPARLTPPFPSRNWRTRTTS